MVEGMKLLAALADLTDRASENRKTKTTPEDWDFDFFISHASEDKVDVARPLFQALIDLGYRVWFDEHEIVVGDSLRERIDEGLRRCGFGWSS